MPLQRSEKEAVVADMSVKLGRAYAVVVADYRGLNVAQLGSLRRELRQSGAEIHVVKNSLLRLALEDAGLEALGDVLTGPTMVGLLGEDMSAALKAMRKVAKDTEKLVMKGGLLGGRAIGPSQVAALAELPSREVLLSQFLGLLEAPQRHFLSVLEGPQRDFLSVLGAHAEAA